MIKAVSRRIIAAGLAASLCGRRVAHADEEIVITVEPDASAIITTDFKWLHLAEPGTVSFTKTDPDRFELLYPGGAKLARSLLRSYIVSNARRVLGSRGATNVLDGSFVADLTAAINRDAGDVFVTVRAVNMRYVLK